MLSVATSSTHAGAISGQGFWETTLKPRDLDGDTSTIEAYYDAVLNITWLANANLIGIVSWEAGVAWASGLNINGINGWRLPKTNPVNGETYNYDPSYSGATDRGYNISAPDTLYAGSIGSEMAHLFYNTLGNKSSCDPSSSTVTCDPQAGSGLTNTGPFNNIQSIFYWSGTVWPPSPDVAFVFNFGNGNQSSAGSMDETIIMYAWAVHDGDIGTAVATTAKFMPWLPILLE